MKVPRAVLTLVARFREHRDEYLSALYNEATLRKEFLEPLFAAMGWDVDNTKGYAEAYKEVVHEDALKVSGATKAPDYAFRLGGARKFFVEAKKPSVDVKGDPSPAYQLRRYAWSAKLPLSILTDFHEFAVYDCTKKPSPTDTSATARILYLTCEDYAERWEEIASLFSPEAIQKGAFDQFASSVKGKKGTAAVDDAFLGEIETWRDLLARHLALRNAGLSQRELNDAVQRTIDRIIFLRICEDRGIEPYGELQALLNGTRVYPRLAELFRRADERYNSGLFHFRPEKDRPGSPDTLTLTLEVDDKVLKEILGSLYYPVSPYEFSVLPLDLLGHVYEQFLGKVIRLTAGHRAVVEDKPEVKKAGGVYYTPTYIVDYIVKNTVGKLLENKTPKEAATLRVLDPACGSGSFLLGAYQCFLDWHQDWYAVNGPEKWARGRSPKLYRSPKGDWRLTTAERKRILLDHLYGVDIDPQAVEVTKLSLLLKVLEGENAETLGKTLKLLHERALPDLGRNIQCGNSLIGTDFYDDHSLETLSEEERYRINAFDWETAFPDIMKEGGFDVVIGNPPYVYRNALDLASRRYFAKTYASAEGNYDLYKFFLERGVNLVRKDGRIGMIVSASFLVQPTSARLRAFLLERTAIERLAPLGPGAFAAATVDTAVIVAQAGPASDDHVVVVAVPSTPCQLPDAAGRKVLQKRFATNPTRTFDCRLSEEGAALVKRLRQQFPRIEEFYEFSVGINTGFIRSELVAATRLDSRYHEMILGSGISRYGTVRTEGWILYDPDFIRSRGRLGRSLPPERFFQEPKILVVRTRNLSLTRRIVATIDRDAFYNLNRLTNVISRGALPLEGLLGILNSQLFNWLFSTRFLDYEVKPVYLRGCPLVDVTNGPMNEKVSGMLELHRQSASARTSHERELIDGQIAITDRQINELVYKLYGLTDEEVRMVEETTRE